MLLSTGLDKLLTARNAGREVSLLRNEVLRLARIVSIIHSHLQSGIRLEPQAMQYLLDQLEGAKITVADLDDALQQYLHTRTGQGSKVKYLWKDMKGEVRRLRSNLTRARVDVEGVLTLAIL